MSHSGLLFKFKSIGVGGFVLSICREFLSNPRQRVVFDGAASEWIPIISVMPQGSVIGLLFILYTSKMFELVENRLFAYSYDSTPHYWQLFASQQTGLLLLPRFSGTWLGFRSGAITGA